MLEYESWRKWLFYWLREAAVYIFQHESAHELGKDLCFQKEKGKKKKELLICLQWKPKLVFQQISILGAFFCLLIPLIRFLWNARVRRIMFGSTRRELLLDCMLGTGLKTQLVVRVACELSKMPQLFLLWVILLPLCQCIYPWTIQSSQSH